MDPKAEFIAWVQEMGEEKACEVLGKFPSTVKRWVTGSHKPDYDSMFKFWEHKHRVNGHLNGDGSKMNSQLTATPQSLPSVSDIVDANSAIAALGVVEANKLEEQIAVRDVLARLLAKHEGKDIQVLFPCYKETNAATTWNLLQLAMDFGRDKIGFDMEIGDAMIVNARNKLATRFLKSGATWSFWLDSDMILPMGRPTWFKDIVRQLDLRDDIAGTHTIHRLMSHKKTFVGGTYFGRFKNAPPMFNGMLNKSELQKSFDMKGELIPTDWVGTGCILVHRQVYLDIQAKFPELAPVDDREHWDFFRRFTDGNGKGGEDVAFCRRAREAGHQVYMDTGVQCGHVGYFVYGAWTNRGAMGYAI